MRAKYPGKCPACGQPFEAGTAIEYDTRTKKATHAQCPEVHVNTKAFITEVTRNTACLLPEVGQVIERDGVDWKVIEAQPIHNYSPKSRYSNQTTLFVRYRVICEAVLA